MAKQAVETPADQPKASKKDAVPKALSFFDRMKKIEAGDWGTRAKIKVYRLEPIIDQLRVSANKYIRVFEEPITEEMIKRDPSCGSGRYRLYLTFKAPTDNEKEIDSVEIEVLDTAFPPKVAKGTWLDDPRNEKWAWAKKHYEAEQKNGNVDASGFLQGLEVLDRIDSRARERYTTSDPVDTVDKIIGVAQRLAPQPPPPQTENKTLESIVALMIAQSDRSQKQSDMLLQMLLTQFNNKPNPAPEKTSIKEVIALVKDEVLPLVEKLKPGEVIDGITRRSKMSGWQEMLQPAIPVVVDFLKPFAAGLATNLFARAGSPAAPPVFNGNGAVPQPQPNGSQSPALPQPPQQQNSAMPPLLNMIAPALLNYMRVDEDPQELGEDFASWVHEGYQADPRFNSAIGMARAGGPQMIIAQFKGSPWWMDKGANHDQLSLAEMEGKFGMFVNAFLNWQPGAQVEDGSPEVIDIG